MARSRLRVAARIERFRRTIRRQPGGRTSLSIFDWLKEPLLVVGVVFLSTTAVAQPFYVPSGSMEPTLKIGDELLATKFAYGYGPYSMIWGVRAPLKHRVFAKPPMRGDVVVFHPPAHLNQAWVKRVIGLPGDRIVMRNGYLSINGQKLKLVRDGNGKMELPDGSVINAPRYIETLPGGVSHPIFKLRWNGPLDNTAVFVVPKDHLFLMGDNRDNSLDSRVAQSEGGLGYVPMTNLVGRADLLIGSWDFLAPSENHGGPFGIRLARFFHSVH